MAAIHHHTIALVVRCTTQISRRFRVACPLTLPVNVNIKKGELNMSFINCTIIDKETVICDNETYKATDLLTYEDKGFWIYLGIYVGLVLFAGW